MNFLFFRIYQLFLAILIFVLAFMIACSLFAYPNFNFGPNNSLFDPLYACLIAFFYLLIFRFVFRIISKKDKKIGNYFLLFLLFLFVIFQFVFSIYQHRLPNTDTGYVYIQAQNLAVNNQHWSHYFYIYPNNVNISIFLSIFYRFINVFNISNPIIATSFLQIFLLDASILFLYKVIKKYLNQKASQRFLIFSFLYLPFSFFSQFIYNDLISISLLFFSISLFLIFLKTKSKYIKLLSLFASAFLMGFSYQLRSNLLLVILAFLITFVLRKESFKEKILNLATIMIAVVISAGIFSAAQSANGFKREPNLETPSLRWINMSLNPNTQGQIDGRDGWLYETQGYSFKKKQKLYKKALAKRLSNYDIVSITKHFFDKSNLMFSRGWISDTEYTQVNSRGSSSWFTRNSYLVINVFRPFYLLLLLLSLITIIKKFREKNIDELTIFSTLSILAIFSFHVFLWEAGERYGMLLMPFVLLLASFEDNLVMPFHNNIGGYLFKKGNLVIFLSLMSSLFIFSYFRNFSFTNGFQQSFVIKAQPFTRYAMKEDYDFKPGERLDFKIYLPQRADSVFVPIGNGGYPGNLYEKNFRVELINKKNNSSYDLLKNGGNLQANFPAGEYLLRLQNVGESLVPTRMVINKGGANFDWVFNRKYSSNQRLIPSFSFSKKYFIPRITDQNYNLIWFIVFMGTILLINLEKFLYKKEIRI